ncbi:MAG TPA: hypothetical protein VJ020_01040 [Anaerolineales bacterium]|nr:hypothetical protein [Anaerolineales bacterium]
MPKMKGDRANFGRNLSDSAICISSYADGDGDGVKDSGEGLVRGEWIGIENLDSGKYFGPFITDGDELRCVEELGEAEYRIVTLPPDFWKPTTKTYWQLVLLTGSTANIEFGVQPKGVQESYQQTDTTAQSRFAIALVILSAATPLIALASLILNIIVLRRLGKLLKTKAGS